MQTLLHSLSIGLFSSGLLLAISACPAAASETNIAVRVRHAPSLNGHGAIHGSVHQLLGENVTLNGGFLIDGDLLVPGTPAVRTNGQPVLAGIVAGAGSELPGDYRVTLNGNCSLGHILTRSVPVDLPAVALPPAPAGTRRVTINRAGEWIGDPASIYQLTLNASVGQVAVPPGTYGRFIANSGSGFTLGTAGASEPAVYQLDELVLSGQASVEVVGPVLLILARSLAVNGVVGSSNNPAWLQLQVARGGVTLNGGAVLFGSVTAPAGTVTVNGHSLLVGAVQSDRLTVNGGGEIRWGRALNQDPVAAAQSVVSAEDALLELTLRGADPEGAALTFLIVSEPAHGTLTLMDTVGTNGSVTAFYRPAENFNGTDSFTFKVNDGQADSQLATVQIEVTPVNDPPIVLPQKQETAEDVPVDFVLVATDIENDPLTFSIVTLPSHGVLVTNTGSSASGLACTYVPDPDYAGDDSFVFSVSDGEHAVTSVVQIIVNPVNDRPVANGQEVALDEDTEVVIVLSAVDAEGSALSFHIVSEPVHGELESDGSGPNHFRYRPATNYFGPDAFTFSASDGVLTSEVATVRLTIRPVNDVPLVPPQTLRTLEDTAAAFVLSAFDVEGDALQFTVLSPPENGTLSGSAPDLIFSPEQDFHGTNQLVFEVNDGQGTSAPVVMTVIVVPVNDPPVATAQALVLDEDGTLAITLSGSDVDGDALTFIVVAQPTNGVLRIVEDNLIYTPDTNFHGSDAFAFEAHDGITNSAPALITLEVRPVNDPPVVEAGPDLQVTVGEIVQLSGAVWDPDDSEGEGLVVMWRVSEGAGLVHIFDPFSAETLVQFSEVGTFILQLAASDETVTVSDELVVVVLPVNRAPEVMPGSGQVVMFPNPATLAVQVVDDGLPEGGILTIAWSVVSGPGEVNFSHPFEHQTTAWFGAPGECVVRCTVSDGALESYADVRVLSRTPAMNQAPIVSAGPDKVIGLTNRVMLEGSVSDDGLPEGSAVFVEWSVVAGPGMALFEDPASARTGVSFSAAGKYVLRLMAWDSELSAADEASITVYPHNLPPVVDAGPDQRVVLPDPELLYPNPFGVTNVNTFLSRSLFSVDHWNHTIGRPGLTYSSSGATSWVRRNCLAVAPDYVVAAGSFDSAGGIPAKGIARWDGTNWFNFYDTNAIPEQCGHAGCSGAIVGWLVLDCASEFCNENFECVGARGREVFAGAQFKDLGNLDGHTDMSARWDGERWRSWVFKQAGNHVRVFAATEDMVYVGGHFAFQPTNATSAQLPHLPWSYGVAGWDGTNWIALGSGVQDIRDYPHSSVPGLNVYYSYVACLAAGRNGDLYVGGEFIFPTPFGYATNVAHWDGEVWRPLGGGIQVKGLAGTDVRAMALADSGDLYVGGAFTNAGGVPVRNIARWDGQQWFALGAGPANGVNGTVEAIAVHERDVYVGGTFSEAGGFAARNIARWDGQAWSLLGDAGTDGTSGGVFSLAANDSGVYVGGMFSQAGGAAAKNIALWEFAVPPAREIELKGQVTDDGLPVGGELRRWWTKVSGPGEVKFGDASASFTTAAFSKAGTYVLRLTASDSDLEAMDEVTVEIVANRPPVVDAGPDQVIGLDEPLALNGFVRDDGLPEGAPVHHVWKQLYGPGVVTFDHPGRTNVTALFSRQGTYVLRLMANDSQFTVWDDVTVVVRPANRPPTVYPGSTVTIRLGETRTMNAQVNDDGAPAGVLKCLWTQVSGPAPAIFSDATRPDCTVSFTATGSYVFRIVATDSELTTAANVTITVLAPNNSAPIVSAGPDRTVTNLFTRLEGSVSDDGRPWGSALDVFWSTTATGVTFANSNSPTTAVTFSRSGTYLLQLNARDGVANVSDVVVITIPNQPPWIDAGPDRSITLPWNSVQLAGLAFDTTPLTYNWSRLSGPGSVTFNPANALTTTATFSVAGTYVLRLRVTDSGVSYEDTVRVIVAPPGNVAPEVDAGPDQVLVLPTNAVTLDGGVTDDGLPTGAVVSLEWTQIFGPAPALIPDPIAPNPEVRFTEPGRYVFRLTASDTELVNGDDVVVLVKDPVNEPPLVTVPDEIVTRVTNTILLEGLVTDDGLPAGGELTAFWRKRSGPGLVSFGAPGAVTDATNRLEIDTSVSFNLPGTYVLRLTADDAQLTSFAEVTVTVLPAEDNEPPVVDAGLDANTVAYQPFILSGSVADDGLPAGSQISVAWSVVSGPGRVYFSDARELTPYAQFAAAGTYVLRLAATDGRATTTDDVRIEVSAPINEAPFVFAGLPLETTRPHPALLQGVVLDDGLPLGVPVTTTWTKASGPGEVTFAPGPGNPLAWAYFSAPGEYVLRLTASDSVLSNSAEVVVHVHPGTNAAPHVNAGPDFVAVPGEPVRLHTEVSDDGLEQGWTDVFWSVVSGPGPVPFTAVNGVYYAFFPETGEYTLRLTADDGDLISTDDVVVTVSDAAPPLAEIAVPVDGAVITSPSEIIGTAESAILKSYVVELRLKPPEFSPPDELEAGGVEGWCVVSSNTVSVSSNLLGVLDPTLSLNGLYELRLTVTDLAGRSAVAGPVTVVFDRALKIGHFRISFNDLVVPVAGLPLQVTRTYDSRAAMAGVRGDFGIGWTMDIRNVRLQKNRALGRNWVESVSGTAGGLSLRYMLDPIEPRLVTITFPDGRVEKFRLDPLPLVQPLLPIQYPQWRFTPLGNTRGTLEPAGVDEGDGNFMIVEGSIPGTVNLYDLNFFFGAVGDFGSAVTQEELDRYPTLFRYTSAEGLRYLIDEHSGLQSVTDPNGNTLLVGTNGITWSNAVAAAAGQTDTLAVLFQRDGFGRITNIVDAAGHALAYRYSENGDLVAFRNRDGDTNGFAYGPDHLLCAIHDSRGVQIVGNEYDGAGRLVHTTDAVGNATGFFHDIEHRREVVTNRLGFVTVSEYDDHGNVIRFTDAAGNVSAFEYDAHGNLLVRSNASDCACATRYEYDDADNLVREIDAAGNVTRYTYNFFRKPLTVIEPSGFATTNHYDARGNLLATRDSAGQVTTFTYNAAGKVTSITDPRGAVTRFAYNEFGFLTNEVDALGNVTDYTVDANGNLLSQAVSLTRISGLASVEKRRRGWLLAGEAIAPPAPVTNTLRLVMRYEYTPSGLPLRTLYYDGTRSEISYTNGKPHVETDPLGRQTTFEYNSLGLLSRKVHPDGCTETFEYDAEGRLVMARDRRGQETWFDYDPRGKLVRTRFADGSEITATYYPDGSLQSETSKSGETTFYELDALGNRISATDSVGVTRYTYDYRGLATSKVDPLLRTNRYEYDALSRNVGITRPDGTGKAATFVGRLLTSETDPNGHTTFYGYDLLGRLVAVTNALGEITRFAYDEQGNRISETDPLGRTTFFEYDVMRRRVGTVYPDGSSTAYDAAGRVIARTNQLGDVTCFEYDSADNVVAITDPLGRTTRCTYDCGGNRLALTTPDGVTTRFEYDALSRLTRITSPCGTTEEFVYDFAGRLIARTDPEGRTIRFTWDTRDQLIAVTNALGETTRFEYDAAGNRVREIDALGQVTQHEYDALNRLVRTVLPDGALHEFAYDGIGRLVAHKDPAGGITRRSHDAVGRLLAVTDPVGRMTRFEYDPVGNLVSWTEPGEGTVRYEYDLLNRRTRALFPDGSSQSVTCDKAGFPVAFTDALGHDTIFEFDAAGQQTGIRDALGYIARFDYDLAGRVRLQMDADARVTQFEYDCAGRLARVIGPDNTARAFGYDNKGRVISETDANNNSTRFEYDAADRLTARIDALGNATRFTYDALGRLETRTDAKQRVTRFAYDELGRLIRVTHPDGAVETAEYDERGRRVAVTDAAGNRTSYAYDDLGRLVAVTNALGDVTACAWDVRGNLAATTDANGHVTAFEYDGLDRLIRTTYADGSFEETRYDAEGRRVADIDAAGVEQHYAYDPRGRLVAVTNALGGVTTFEYDASGRPVAQVDANGHRTTFDYDAMGRRVRRALPGGESEGYRYDAVGNLIARTNFDGRVTTYTYDALNRLTSKVPDPLFGSPPVTFSYDSVGMRTNMTDASGATTCVYDLRDRLVRKDVRLNLWGGAPLVVSLNYAYDLNGNLTNVLSSDPNGTAVAYEYDAVNRLVAVNDLRVGRTSYAYDPVGNLQTWSAPNRLISHYTHDALNRVTNLATFYSPGDGPVFNQLSAIDYQLAPTGHRLRASEAFRINGETVVLDRVYRYDALYRLTNESVEVMAISDAGAANTLFHHAFDYAYDAVGNRLSRGSTFSGLPGTVYSYDANDWLASDRYDPNGNTIEALIGQPAVQVADAYDFEDRLTRRLSTINHQPSTIHLAYNGLGHRVAKRISSGLDNITTFYLVDDLNPTGYSQVLEEYVAVNNAPPIIQTVHGHGLGPLSRDDVVGTNWVTHFYGADGQGSVRQVTDLSGALVQTIDYDAFGNVLLQRIRDASTGLLEMAPAGGGQPAVVNARLFGGGAFDSDLGLYYLRARYADPDRGRFWTMDRFEGFMDDPPNLHKYAFNRNDPVNRLDPSGHISIGESLAVSALAPMVRDVVLDFFEGANQMSHGLAGGNMLKFTTRSEACLIDSLAAGPGWGMGKPNFWASMKGTPFLLSWNPNVWTGKKPCGYECVPFDLDVPVYGPGARHPLFETQPGELLAELMDTGQGSLLGATLRAIAESYAGEGASSASTARNFLNNMSDSLFGIMAGAVSPDSYREGFRAMEDHAYAVMLREMEGGAGGVWSLAQGISAALGDVVGYNRLYEAAFGLDRRELVLLAPSDRWARGFEGLSAAAFTVAGGLKGFHPNRRSLRLADPRVPEPAGTLLRATPDPCARRTPATYALRERVEEAIPRAKQAEISEPRVENLRQASVSPRRVAFYVNPRGETLPATAYRYMDSKYAETVMQTMEAPLSYFGFEKFSTGSEARDAFQIFFEAGNPKSWSDARLRGTFDTLQLFTSEGELLVKIPLERGGLGPLPEPFTRSYPEYGRGNTYQLVPAFPNLKVKFSEVTLLPEE